MATIVKSIGGESIAQPTQSTPSSVAPKFLPPHVEDPKTLARKLNDLVAHVDAQTSDARSSPLATFNILENVSLTSGQTTVVKHLLGKPCTRYICVRARTASWAVFDGTMPAGLTNATHLALHSDNTGTYDILVF
jgi:hypothetical protein